MELKGRFSIPMLKNQEWENENRKVIALYRKKYLEVGFLISHSSKQWV